MSSAGTQITDMTVTMSPLPAETYVPVAVTSPATGLNPRISYRYDLGTDLLTRVSFSTLADTTGASLVGSDDGDSGSLWTTIAGFIAYLKTSGGSSILGFIQSGAGTVFRYIQDKCRDSLNLRDFAGADPTGVLDSTTAAKNAVLEAIASGKPLCWSRGDWLITDSVLPTTLTENLTIYGEGRNSTTIINRCIGKTLFNAGNTYWFELRDMAITGNGLTGASGNGHAISLVDPAPGVGTILPGHTQLRRLRINEHQGLDVARNNVAMPACGIYDSGSLGLVMDSVYLGYNSFGMYASKAAQPTLNVCTFDHNKIAALINDQCENMRVNDIDVVGDHGVGAVTAVTGADGMVRVNALGVQSTGGTLVKAGAVTDFFGVGSEYDGGKNKNHLYTAYSANSPHLPLITGMGEIRQDVDGACGIFSSFGVRAIDNAFLNGNPETGSISNRYGIWSQIMGGYAYLGELRGNHFINGGNQPQGTAIFIDSSASGGASQSGVIDANSLGDTTDPGSAITWVAFLRVTGAVSGLAVTNNHAVAAPNVTITTVYNYTGITVSEEGLIEDNNSYLNQGGTITTGKVLPTNYTGLQRSTFFNVIALSVGGVQVVGARNTGWTAGTGTPSKTAFAAYAGATMSAGYVQAEAQATNDAVKADSQRLLAIEQALTAHGLIGP